jgi:peptidoglycan/LPS O-acetylase OafA/YrhL
MPPSQRATSESIWSQVASDSWACAPAFLLAARFVPVLWRSLLAAGVYGAALVALSLLVHRFVEEPLRKWISRRLVPKSTAVLT